LLGSDFNNQNQQVQINGVECTNLVFLAARSNGTNVLDMLIKLKLSDVVYLPQPSSTLTPSNTSTSTSNTTIPLSSNDGPAALKSNLFVELHKAWDANKINTVIGLLKELEHATPFAKKHLFVAIDSFVMCIHEKTKLTTETVFDIK
jgi:hypothetical protein